VTRYKLQPPIFRLESGPRPKESLLSATPTNFGPLVSVNAEICRIKDVGFTVKIPAVAASSLQADTLQDHRHRCELDDQGDTFGRAPRPPAMSLSRAAALCQDQAGRRPDDLG